MLANNVCKSIMPYYGNNSMVILEILLGNIFSMKNINPHILVQIPLAKKAAHLVVDCFLGGVRGI